MTFNHSFVRSFVRSLVVHAVPARAQATLESNWPDSIESSVANTAVVKHLHRLVLNQVAA
jgi:hypothetical protein